MAYRFAPRSTTPGEYRLAPGTLSQLIAVGDIQSGVGRGDGDTGTLVLPTEAQVELAVGFGASGTEFTGELDPGGIPIPTPTGTDPVLDLADLLVSHLTALAAGITTSFTASWKSDPVQDLAAAAIFSPVVWVTDLGAAIQTDNSGVILEEFELLIILQRKIAKTETADTVCRAMSEIMAEIANYCRKTVLDPGSAGNGSACFKLDRERARDFKEWHEADLYRAELTTHWRRGYVGDE